MRKFILSLLLVLLLSSYMYAQGGVYLPVSSGVVPKADAKVSAVNSYAFIDFADAGIFADKLGHYIRIQDSLGNTIGGFIKSAGTGETYGSEISSGFLTFGRCYQITATESNHFGAGLTVGAYFTQGANFTGTYTPTIINGELYVTGTFPFLYRWNGSNDYISVASPPNTETSATASVVFNNKIYIGTALNARLFEWNGTDAWVMVADNISGELVIRSMAVFNSKIYATTNTGKLLEWNGTNAWVIVAFQYENLSNFYSLIVFNNELYAGSDASGKLLKWNGTNAWTEVVPQFGSETFIYSLVVFNNKLYAGTAITGKLLEFNGTNAWTEVAPQYSGETYIVSLAVFNNKIYGGSGTTGKLLEWNGTNAWVEVAPKLGTASIIRSLTVFNNKLYGGASNGQLYEWNGTNAWVVKAPVDFCNTNNKVKQVTAPAVTGVKLVNAKGGTTYNLKQTSNVFNISGSSNLTYQIYKVLDAVIIDSDPCTNANATINLTAGSAAWSCTGINDTAYQDGKHIIAVYDAAGVAAFGYYKASGSGAVVNTKGGATQNWISIGAGFSTTGNYTRKVLYVGD